MSVLGTIVRTIGWKGGALLSALGVGIAYKKSSDAEAEDRKDGKLDDPSNGAFKRGADEFITKTAIPLGTQAVQGVTSVVGAAISGTAGLVEEGAKQAPRALKTAGELTGTAVAASKEASDKFYEGFGFSKGWAGWATAATGVVGAALALKTGILGDVGKNFATKILDIPMNIVTASMTLAGQILTPFVYIGAALVAGWLLLTQNGHQFMSDVYNGIKGMFPSAPKQPQPEVQQAPVVPSVAPTAPEVQAPVAMLDINGVTLPKGVSGGDSVTRSSLQDNLAMNPRRDVKNSPNLSTSA